MAEIDAKKDGDKSASVPELISLTNKGDLNGVKALLLTGSAKVDDTDESGMTALHHASYKGNKDMCQLLLDHGADPNSDSHDHRYSALHFAALSGNTATVQLLLTAGAKTYHTNTLGRVASQMAAFVGNHQVVALINNYVPKSSVDYFTKISGLEKEPKLPLSVADPLYHLIMQVTLHPVRIALTLEKSQVLMDNIAKAYRVLELLCEKEYKRQENVNEMVFDAISCGTRGTAPPHRHTLPLPASLLVLLPLLASPAAVPISAQDEVPTEVTEDPVGAIRHLLPEVNLERGRSITVVKGQLGETLFLPCRFHEVTQDQEVSWFRRRDWHILTAGVFTYTNDKRFSVLHIDGSIDWTLQLRKAQPSDNGTYECQMSTGSGVVSRFVEVMVAVPEARIISGSFAQVQEGGTLTLRCVVKHSPNPRGIVFWYHEDAMLNFGSRRHNITTRKEGAHAYSRLVITSARPADSGNYTCSSRNSRAAFVSVSVTQDSPSRSPMTTTQTSAATAITVHILCTAVVALAVHTFAR